MENLRRFEKSVTIVNIESSLSSGLRSVFEQAMPKRPGSQDRVDGRML
jgi:hypothetical protein